MTIVLFYAFTITTFIAGSGAGASCGIGTSPEYPDKVACDLARQEYDQAQLPLQTPSRRISTLDCTLRVRVE